MKTIVFVLILAVVSALFLIISNIRGHRRGSAGFFHRRIGGAGWSQNSYGMSAWRWLSKPKQKGNAYNNENERKWNKGII